MSINSSSRCESALTLLFIIWSIHTFTGAQCEILSCNEYVGSSENVQTLTSNCNARKVAVTALHVYCRWGLYQSCFIPGHRRVLYSDRTRQPATRTKQALIFKMRLDGIFYELLLLGDTRAVPTRERSHAVLTFKAFKICRLSARDEE